MVNKTVKVFPVDVGSEIYVPYKEGNSVGLLYLNVQSIQLTENAKFVINTNLSDFKSLGIDYDADFVKRYATFTPEDFNIRFFTSLSEARKKRNQIEREIYKNGRMAIKNSTGRNFKNSGYCMP